MIGEMREMAEEGFEAWGNAELDASPDVLYHRDGVPKGVSSIKWIFQISAKLITRLAVNTSKSLT